MNDNFQELRRKQRFSLRKLNVGVASVLLGFTVFGYNVANNSQVVHADTATNVSGDNTGSTDSSDSTATTEKTETNAQTTDQTTTTDSSKTDQVSPENKAVTSESTTTENTQSGTSTDATKSDATNSNVDTKSTDDKSTTSTTDTKTTTDSSDTKTSEDKSTTTDSSKDSTATSNDATATDAVKTTTSDASKTTNNVEVKTLTADQAKALLTNLAATDSSTLPTSSQTYSKVEQPILYDYLTHLSATGKRDGNTWVNKTLNHYPDATMDTIFGTTSKPGIITKNPDKYFFAAYVDYSEGYHRVILLARSQDPSDKNLYTYTVHTYWQNIGNTTTKPGETVKEVYSGAGGSTHDLYFRNYGGESFTVILDGFKDGYGLLPVFDNGLLDPVYGSNTKSQNDTAAKQASIGGWGSAIPQESTTEVRYVDQATGKDIVQPLKISGFGYQGFKLNGDAPTVDGYHLVSSPKSLGLAYEDGTIAPYQVGHTYDQALSDKVVIKQTVLDTDGTIRATAYYEGKPLLDNASKVLGHESYNDTMNFIGPDGQTYNYTNLINQVDNSYTYYYAKDSDPNGSDMNLHFIDVTGVNNSHYAPSDGPEVNADNVQTIHGNIGSDYTFNYTVPTGYQEVASSGVSGTYSGKNHDAYVYVKKIAENKLYNPTGGTVNVKQGSTLTADQAKAAITNNGDLPADATYSWDTTTPINTANVANGQKANVIVTYGDHTTSTVPVTVNVVSNQESGNYTVDTGNTINLTHNQSVKAGDSIDPSAVTVKDSNGQTVNLPDGASVVWAKAPDTSTVGNNLSGQGSVFFQDGSSLSVNISYNVTPTDAESNAPTPVTTPVKTDENTTLTADQAKAAIANNSDMPEGTTYTWNKQPDTTKYGDTTGEVTVTFPDKTTKTVTVPVHVNSDAENNTPEVSTPTVDQNAEVDPNSVVTNKDSLPKGTTYSWTTKPKTSDSNTSSTGMLHVSYPDGSSEDVPVTVNVKQNADQYNPTPVTAPVKTGVSTTLTADQAKAAIANNSDMPEGTTYTWSKQPDTTKTGDTTGEVTVTFPDKTTKTVIVPVHVSSDADTYKIAAGNPVKVDDPKNLTDEEKGQVKDSIKQANPDAPIDHIDVNNDGSSLVTFKDGSTTSLSPNVIKKTDADKYAITPGDAVKVEDPENLSDTEKGEVRDSITKANPDAPIDHIDVNNDGSSLVTFKDGSTTSLKPNVIKKTDSDHYPLHQGQTVKVDDPENLNDTEKGEVRDSITKANPDAPIKEIAVNNDGSAKVTFNDGSTQTVPANVMKKTDSDNNRLVPGNPVKVDDPKNLSQTEKDQVDKSIRDANPAAPIDHIDVNSDGSSLVTFKDGSKQAVPANVIKKTDADKTALNQGNPVKVDDPKNLTDEEKGQVKDSINQANPDAPIKDISVNNDGSAKVTFDDGSTTTVPANVVKKTDADKNPLKSGNPIKVDDPKNLTDEEKGQVKDSLTKANPDAPIKDVEVNNDGSAKVTFNDGSTTTVPSNVIKKTDADKNPLKTGNPVKVDDPKNLTDEEKDQVKDSIKQANPDAPIKDVEVNNDGSAKVTFNDGSTTTVPANVTKKNDADKNPLKTGNPVKVDDPSNLTDPEKSEVADSIKKANPDAPIKNVSVNKDGSATVTFDDGSTTTVPSNVTKKTDADKNPLKSGNPVKVDDPSHLTDDEKGQVKDSITKANPDAPIKEISVNDDGSATVTFNDGSTTTVPANVTKKTDADRQDLKPGNPVKVDDPSNLTDPEKNEVVDSIKKANPDAPIKNVSVNNDGSATVTFNDGSTKTVPANVVKKSDADKNPLKSGNPVKVDDPKNLTDPEKSEVADSIKQANPDAPIKNVAVNNDGSATVTFNDGSTTTVPANVTKKNDADKNPLKSGNPVKVDDPSNLTDPEKSEVAESIKKANPDAPIKEVAVNNDGSATVTFNDGSTTTVPSNVTKKNDADKNPLKPGNPVKVDDSSNLTDPEKSEVADSIKQANPDAPIKNVAVNNDGSATVTFNDGSTTTVPSNVVKKTDADKNPLKSGNPVKVDDPKNLTNPEKSEVADSIKQANPNAPIKEIVVNNDGSAKVTFNDGSSTTVPSNVVKKTDADKNPLKPGNPVKVDDPKKLSNNEKAQVQDSIKQANPNAPIKNISVNDDGSSTVVFNDGSTVTVPANVIKKSDADKNPLKPGNPVKVDDPSNLTDPEKGEVADSIKKANPDAPIKNVAVNNDGSATVTFNDGSTTIVPSNVTKKTDADKNPLKSGNPVKVDDPKNLTDPERGEVVDSIKKANPDAPIKNVAVNNDGSATVTFNDGSTTTVPSNVTKKNDADKNPLKPGNPVKVDDPKNLTDPEKGEVVDSIKKANPDAPIKNVAVNNDGSAKVTFNDGSTTTIPSNVTKKTDADKNPLLPGNPVKVDDPSHLTDDEKGQVKDSITKANPTAPIKSVEVNDDGSATVKYNDGSTTTVPANVIKKTDADKNPLLPAKPVEVVDPSHLTDAEKGKVADGIKQANPDAPIKSIDVHDDGSATVTFPDGSTITVPKNVVEKEKPENPQTTPDQQPGTTETNTDAETNPLQPGKPVEVTDPSHLTDGEKGQVGDSIKQANPSAPIKNVDVHDNGSATVTFNDGSTVTVPSNVVKHAEGSNSQKTDADKNANLKPGQAVQVKNPKHLTDAEKGQVEKAIRDANPTAPIKEVTVSDDGSAKVVFNDGSSEVITANLTVAGAKKSKTGKSAGTSANSGKGSVAAPFEEGNKAGNAGQTAPFAETSKSGKTAEKLPQTGEKESATLLGMLLALFGLGLAWFTKKRSDEK